MLVRIGAGAKPGMTLRHASPEDTAADSIHSPSLLARSSHQDCLMRLEQICDDTAVDGTTAWMSSLIGRDLGRDYYVGITAGKAWRPLQNYGDYDNKLRVYNPTIGVMLKYSF